MGVQLAEGGAPAGHSFSDGWRGGIKVLTTTVATNHPVTSRPWRDVTPLLNQGGENDDATF